MSNDGAWTKFGPLVAGSDSIARQDVTILGHRYTRELFQVQPWPTAESRREARMGHAPQVVTYLVQLIASGLLDEILKHATVNVSQAMEATGWTCRPQIGICLRMMASCGWFGAPDMDLRENARFELTTAGRRAFESAKRMKNALTLAWNLVRVGRRVRAAIAGTGDLETSEVLQETITSFIDSWGVKRAEEDAQVVDYLDGTVGQIVHLSLLRAGVVVGPPYTPVARNGIGHDLESCLEAMTHYGYMAVRGDAYVLEPLGIRAARAYTGWLSMSYLETFASIPGMLRSDLSILSTKDSVTGFETHVDRELNIIGSKINHRNMLTVSNVFGRWLPDVFSVPPFREQPNYVCDMGCGTGALLLSFCEAVREKTARGRDLVSNPLTLIGVDYNRESCEFAERALENSGEKHLVMMGDVTAPRRLAADLESRGIQRDDVVHIRSFLDHDRSFTRPADASLRARPLGTGVYMDSDGRELTNGEVEANLVEYLAEWRSILGRWGLFVIELHAAKSSDLADGDGCYPIETEYVQFATGQFPVEYEVWMASAREAGLRIAKSYCFVYGESKTTYVSISHLLP